LIDTAKKSLALPAKDIQTAVIKDVDEFIGDASQLDDITLVIVVRD
jgi:serine phosphatase RsbU (regulator of sigma subunit)